MQQSTRKTLELFEEKVTKLARSSFVNDLSSKPLEVNYQRGSNDLFTVEKRFPDAEMRDAFILTFRMLIQNNDPISIGNLAGLLSDAGLSVRFQEQFALFREDLNAYLDSAGLLAGWAELGLSTRRALLHTFIFGEIAHTSKTERPLYERLRKEQLFPVVEFLFLKTIGDVLVRVERVLELVRMELAGEQIPIWVKGYRPSSARSSKSPI